MKPSVFTRIKDLADPHDLRALKLGLIVGVIADLVIAAAIALQAPPVPTVRPTSAPATSCGSCPLPHPHSPSAEVAGLGGKAL
jgi:hypothetical protein